MIGHDPHELAAFLSAVLQGYTRQSAQAELARVFAAQYQLKLTEEVEIRYRTETSTDPETGETTSEAVSYTHLDVYKRQDNGTLRLLSRQVTRGEIRLTSGEPDTLIGVSPVRRGVLGNRP